MKIRNVCAAGVLVLLCAVAAGSQTSVAHLSPEPGREAARARLTDEVMKAWERGGGARQELRLLVLDCDAKGRAYKSEMRQLFPEGTKHLPERLVPRAIYVTTEGKKSRMQYMGKAERGGFKFAMFRVLPGG